MAELVIYGGLASPFVRKVAAVCMEKGLDYEIEQVNIFSMPDWFLEISPLRRIPVLRDRSIADEGPDGTIADSSAICGYLERKCPEPALYPGDAYAYGRALFYEEYADSELAATGGLGIFRPIFFSVMQGKPADLDTARTAWAQKLPPIFAYFDAMLEGRDWLAGDGMSIADISLTCCLMQIDLVAHAPLDQWPRLASHQQRMRERESIAVPFAGAEKFVRKALPERVSLARAG